MKTLKKVMAGTFSIAMMCTLTMSNVSSIYNIPDVQAVDDNNDDWLHAVGSHLYDKDGNEVWLTGANWFGFNCGESCLHGLWSADIDTLLPSIADHGINCLRIPISTELLASWQNGTPEAVSSVSADRDQYHTINPDFCNEDNSIKNSMEIFDVIMSKCKQYGIKVIVDVHSPTAHNSGHNYNVWYYLASAPSSDTMAITGDGTQITSKMWQDSLVWLADKYSNDDTIIAYDLKNEPHGKRGYDNAEPDNIAKWDDSTDENNWKYAAETCASAIMEVNPNALILVEGVEQYPKTEKGYTYATPDIWEAPADVSPWYGAWWGGNLRGVKDYPIDLGEHQSQLVYSPHDYGPGVYPQSWFNKDFTTQTLLDDYWYDTWAYVNDQDIAPLLMGEWGGFMDGAENEKWLNLLRDYMTENHINHTFWCINPNSGDTGGLLNSTFDQWDDEKYALLEEALWQDEDGKYIGLDHQVALGQNGQSLSEYYASGKSSNLDGGKTPDTPSDTTTTTSSTDTQTETTTDTSETEPTTTSVSQTTEDTTPTTTTPITDQTTTPPDTVTSGDSSSESPNPETLVGDVNCDGKVSTADLLGLKKHLLGVSELTDQSLANADVNQDQKVSTADLLALKKILLGID